MERKPTLHSVARRAGVSIASVSRVINGLPSSSINEERIRRAIAELGYQPNSAARALKVNASEQICLALPDLTNPVFQAMTRGVQLGFRFSKYRLMLSPSLSTTEEIVRQLKSLGRNYADGLIINSPIIDEEVEELLNGLKIPVVLMGNSNDRLEFDNIYVDSVRGAALAVEYLYSIGREQILLLNGPSKTHPAKRRKEGFISVLKSSGVKNPDSHVVHANSFSPTAAKEALEEVGNLKKYNAILCANDLLAAGAIKHLSTHGFHVPADMSVVGIDNTDLAELLNPTLTSVDFKAQHRGELAAQYLLERLENPRLPVRKMIIEPELVIRNSTCSL